jgi:hypothetical protein
MVRKRNPKKKQTNKEKRKTGKKMNCALVRMASSGEFPRA